MMQTRIAMCAFAWTMGCAAVSWAQTTAQPGRAIELPAQIAYVEDITVSAPADGMITSLSATEGTRVSKDDVLLKLDARMVESEVEISRQELLAAKDKAEDRSNIEFSAAKYKFAKVEYEMINKAAGKGSASEMELMTKELAKTQAELGKVVAEVEHRNNFAAYHVADAKYKAARVQLEMREYKSPISGVVIEKTADQSEWAQAGQQILRLVNLYKLRAKFAIPSDALIGPSYLIEGADADVVVTLYRGTATREPKTITVKGKVGFVAPTQESDFSYRAWVEFENIDEDGVPVIRDGMVTSVRLYSPHLQPVERRNIYSRTP